MKEHYKIIVLMIAALLIKEQGLAKPSRTFGDYMELSVKESTSSDQISSHLMSSQIDNVIVFEYEEDSWVSHAVSLGDTSASIIEDNGMNEMRPLQETEIQEKIEEEFLTIVETALLFSDYIGEFEHPKYGIIRVYKDGGGLTASYHAFPIPLSHKYYDHFTGTWQQFLDGNFNCSFIRDSFGEITELHMPLESVGEVIVFKRKVSNEFFTIDYLKRFEGLFESELFSFNLVVKSGQLMAKIPGVNDEYALIPEKFLQFGLKEMPGAILRFTAASDGKITEMTFSAPQGTFNFKTK